MIIFVEGADGTGKSTLVRSLENNGYRVMRSVERGDKDAFKHWFYLCNANCVVDRGFITDLVYRTMDGEPRDNMDLMDMLAILQLNCKIIHCDTDTCFEDSIRRGEDNIKTKPQSNFIRLLYKIYIFMFEKFANVPVLKYDWKKDDLSKVIKFIHQQ